MSRIPWSIYQSFTTDPIKTGEGTCRINAADGSVVGFIADYSNAEMIVKAVNEYSALIQEVEKAQEMLEILQEEWEEKDRKKQKDQKKP